MNDRSRPSRAILGSLAETSSLFRTDFVLILDATFGNGRPLQVEYLGGMTGMHEFAEFSAADIGTVDSGLNSIVLASNSEMVRRAPWSSSVPALRRILPR